MPEAPYFPDFYALTQAEVLAIPNSTFSFATSMLNMRLREAWRAHLSNPLEDPPFRRFDPWDAPIMHVDIDVADFPNVPGIRRRRRYRLLDGLLYYVGRDIV